ncbi:MAG: IclR family transcriptional regulator [Rhizobiaceae bacterium]|nr:IclR family transcriptional regulator [Rhizobiaceae bacterium]
MAQQVASGVGLLKKGFQILESFDQGAPAWSQSELARATGLTRSTTSRLVRYLCDCGYLIYHENTGRYRLGPAAVDLGRRASTQFSLLEVAQPILETLSATVDETIILTELNEQRRTAVCIHQIESKRDGLRVFENVGSEFYLHQGAAPRAILAALSESEREEILRQALPGRGARTLTTADKLRVAIDETLAVGYAVSREETYEGVIGVAAPVLWPDRRPVGSVAIAAPLVRYGDQEVQKLGALVRQSASEISARLRSHQTGQAEL